MIYIAFCVGFILFIVLILFLEGKFDPEIKAQKAKHQPNKKVAHEVSQKARIKNKVIEMMINYWSEEQKMALFFLIIYMLHLRFLDESVVKPLLLKFKKVESQKQFDEFAFDELFNLKSVIIEIKNLAIESEVEIISRLTGFNLKKPFLQDQNSSQNKKSISKCYDELINTKKSKHIYVLRKMMYQKRADLCGSISEAAQLRGELTELQGAFLLILMRGMKDDSLFQMKQTVVKETIKKPAAKKPVVKTIESQEKIETKIVKQYHDNGILKSQATLDAEGELHGNSKEWYSSGNIFKDENYKHGIHHGSTRVYFDNGNIRLEYNFKNGKQHGINSEFYEDGGKSIITNLKDGKEHGMKEQFYPSGNLETRTTYVDGMIEGVHLYLNEDGEVVEEKIMQKGLDITMNIMQLMMENNSEHMLKAGLIKEGPQEFDPGELSKKMYEYYKSIDLSVDSPHVSSLNQLLKEGKIDKDFYDLAMSGLGQNDRVDTDKLNDIS